MTKVEMQQKAQEAVGNWKKNALWWEQPKDVENWCVIPTCARGSSLLEANRGHSLEKFMKEFSEGEDPSVTITRFNHWALGWVDVLAVRVYADKERKVLTPAFEKLCNLTETEPSDE